MPFYKTKNEKATWLKLTLRARGLCSLSYTRAERKPKSYRGGSKCTENEPRPQHRNPLFSSFQQGHCFHHPCFLSLRKTPVLQMGKLGFKDFPYMTLSDLNEVRIMRRIQNCQEQYEDLLLKLGVFMCYSLI